MRCLRLQSGWRASPLECTGAGWTGAGWKIICYFFVKKRKEQWKYLHLFTIYSKIFQFVMIDLLMKIWLWTQGKQKQQHANIDRVLTINKIGKLKSNWKEKVCLERRLEWHRTVHQLGYDVDWNLKIMTMTMTVMIMKLISTCRLSLLLMMWC